MDQTFFSFRKYLLQSAVMHSEGRGISLCMEGSSSECGPVLLMMCLCVCVGVQVKIGLVSSQKETEPEKQETREKIEEDRKPQIEAAIVRIMKSRRVLDHNNIAT